MEVVEGASHQSSCLGALDASVDRKEAVHFVKLWVVRCNDSAGVRKVVSRWKRHVLDFREVCANEYALEREIRRDKPTTQAMAIVTLAIVTLAILSNDIQDSTRQQRSYH